MRAKLVFEVVLKDGGTFDKLDDVMSGVTEAFSKVEALLSDKYMTDNEVEFIDMHATMSSDRGAKRLDQVFSKKG